VKVSRFRIGHWPCVRREHPPAHYLGQEEPVIARSIATDEAALEIRRGIEEHRRPFKRRLPSLPHELIDHSTGLSAEMASQLELVLAEDAHGEEAGGHENGVRGVSGMDAECEKQRIEADLGDPCGRKGISSVVMSDSDD